MLPASALPAFYRLISSSPRLPTADQALAGQLSQASSASRRRARSPQRRAHGYVTREAVQATLEVVDALLVDPPPIATDRIAIECVRSLKTSSDGGEADLDQSLEVGVTITPIEDWQEADGRPEWVLPGRNEASPRRMLFLHGGGYTCYHPADPYRPLTTRLAAAFGMPVLVIDYRLAPAHPFPAALEDALNALAWLWDHGPASESSRAESVYICGDSAGGGLALAVIAALAMGELAPGVQLPASCVPPRSVRPTALALISPWSDLTASLPSYATREWDEASLTGDPIFRDKSRRNVAGTRADAKTYAGDVPLADPRVSPVFLPRHLLREWLPPTLMVVGDAEVRRGNGTRWCLVTLIAAASLRLPLIATDSVG